MTRGFGSRRTRTYASSGMASHTHPPGTEVQSVHPRAEIPAIFGGFSGNQHFANSALWGRFSVKTGCRAGLTVAEHATSHSTLPSRGPLAAVPHFGPPSCLSALADPPPQKGPFSDTRQNTRERKVDFAFLPDPSLLLLSPATRHLPF